MRMSLLLAGLVAVGCDDGGRASTTDVTPDAALADGAAPGPDGAPPDADGAPPKADGAPPVTADCRVRDAAAPPDAEAPDAGSPLGACDRACDRATDCATDVCPGFDWTTAPGVTDACYQRCDDAFGAQILGAADCGAVSDLLAAAFGNFAASCESNPCLDACDILGRCIVEECAGFDPPVDRQIAADCAAHCDPGTVSWVLERGSCRTLVDDITAGDPAFGRQCHGEEPPGCPPADLCEAWGEKAAGCIVGQCGGHADAYAAGLRTLISQYCQFDPSCPGVDAVRAVLDEGVTCEAPEYADLGQNEPFVRICRGEVGVPPEAVRGACETLLRCPGTEGFVDADLCMVAVGMREDARPRVECVRGAFDCPEVLDCLGDW